MSTGRLEAFSDGVIAVAVTLLVLDLGVPSPGFHGHSLAVNLAAEWPRYAAYAVSFGTIGIVWMNHHAALLRLREADHSILIVNLLVLMSIAVLPFATSLMASYLRRTGGDQHVAAAVYAGAFLLMGVAFSVLNWLILARRPHLVDDALSPGQRRWVLRRAVLGVPPYALAIALAFVSSYVTLILCGGLALYYTFPQRPPAER